MAKKTNTPEPIGNTMFNVRPIHIARIKAHLDAGFEDVTIHGDGQLFATFTGKDGVKVDGKIGSDHHKEFNSGVEEINKDEVISRAKFRVTYRKGDTLPGTPEEVIKDFYDNFAREMKEKTKPEIQTGFKNAAYVADPKEESAE